MRGELSYIFDIKKVFIIGAGFSKLAGLPLTCELLPLVYQKATEKKYFNSDGEVHMGQAVMLLEELQYYFPLLKVTHNNIIHGRLGKQINLEKFLSFVAAESTFLSTGDRFNEHGSKFLAFIKLWMAEVIYEKQTNFFKNIPDFYYVFAKQLCNSLILTFNWDTLIETLFDKQNIKYRYQLNIENFDERKNSIPLLKLHGSINWFSTDNFYDDKENPDNFTNLGYGFKSIEKQEGDLRIRFNDYQSPWIVVPNYDKLIQLKEYGELWEAPWRYLDDKLEIIFIGFGFRKDDFHTRGFIYPKLVQGSRKGHYRVKVIDYAVNESDRKKIKYRFKGIENCEFWFEGFNLESLNFIFK
jgi:hypothetical protein